MSIFSPSFKSSDFAPSKALFEIINNVMIKMTNMPDIRPYRSKKVSVLELFRVYNSKLMKVK